MMSKLQVASEHAFANPKTGTAGKETCFIDVEGWGAQSGILRQNSHMIKGSYILAEGKLKLNSWCR